ncbi:hypothetical protein ABK040_014307 [Willaertia magna]
MEIKALSSVTLSNITFQDTIKLISYDNRNVVIVTKYDEIYCLNLKGASVKNDSIEEYYFKKLNFTSPFTITHLAYCNNRIILINENNELFLKKCFTHFRNKNLDTLDRMKS